MTIPSVPDFDTELAPMLRRALVQAEQQLRSAHVPSPRHDAEQLASHVLHIQRSELWSRLDEPTPPGFADLVRRRRSRVPLQHITGQAHFRSLTLAVGPGVFIPRPETEIVVEKGLELMADVPEPTVVDLCAGSGAIAVSIARECPRAQVHAVELDPGAMPWLDSNVAGTGVRVHEEDVANCLPSLSHSVDLVIANPPYIPVDAIPQDPEVARFDPPIALYSGPDGLDHLRLIAHTASRLLRQGGYVVIEHAEQQGASASAIFRAATGWTDVVDHRDLTGRDRFVTATWVGAAEGRDPESWIS